MPLNMDESGTNDPCPEDEEFFDARPDAATMEEAIGNFMDGIEAQERDGFKHLHQFVGRLPVPTVNVSPSMSLKDALEGGFLPSMTEEEQKRFTPSELILYKHALEYRWTAEELKKVINMLQRPDFDSKDIDPDLHKRMAKAVDDGRIKCFDLREGPADGDQDLNLWIRELEDVVREIMEDPIFKGNQHFHFEMDLDELGRRLYGGEANAAVSFQIGQLRYIPVHTCS